jgi:hypothetical protein
MPANDDGNGLWAIRSKIVASGEPLLEWDEIEQEVAERSFLGKRYHP